MKDLGCYFSRENNVIMLSIRILYHATNNVWFGVFFLVYICHVIISGVWSKRLNWVLRAQTLWNYLLKLKYFKFENNTLKFNMYFKIFYFLRNDFKYIFLLNFKSLTDYFHWAWSVELRDKLNLTQSNI